MEIEKHPHRKGGGGGIQRRCLRIVVPHACAIRASGRHLVLVCPPTRVINGQPNPRHTAYSPKADVGGSQASAKGLHMPDQANSDLIPLDKLRRRSQRARGAVEDAGGQRAKTALASHLVLGSGSTTCEFIRQVIVACPRATTWRTPSRQAHTLHQFQGLSYQHLQACYMRSPL